MRIRILGSAAGGGLPQWNCTCSNCEAVRLKSPKLPPRTQSSVAVGADGHVWFLLNVSPDIRQQIEAYPPARSGGRCPAGYRHRRLHCHGRRARPCWRLAAASGRSAIRHPLHQSGPRLATSRVSRWTDPRGLVPAALGIMEAGVSFELHSTGGGASGLEVRALALSSHGPRYVAAAAREARAP